MVAKWCACSFSALSGKGNFGIMFPMERCFNNRDVSFNGKTFHIVGL